MNGLYNINLYIKATFSGFLEWPLYTGLTVHVDIVGYLFRDRISTIAFVLSETNIALYLFQWKKYYDILSNGKNITIFIPDRINHIQSNLP